MPVTSSAQQRSAYDPITHFILAPIFLVNLGIAIYGAVHHPAHPLLTAWWIVMSIALIALNIKVRVYSLRVQDRLITLEERLRLAALLPGEPRVSTLTTRQLIALRFAPDAELPGLVHRVFTEQLSPTQIKDSITKWRPDTARI